MQLLREISVRLGRSTASSPWRTETATASVESFRSTRWASATFEGHRHEFAVRFDGRPDAVDASVARFLATVDVDDIVLGASNTDDLHGALGDDIVLGGELLADLALVGEEQASDGVLAMRTLRYEALTVAE